ncbi:MAG: response regulator, partial [Bacteroidaceae bacterium]|nr:response regulator [Bacteroidaceae bacterium]
MDEKLRILLCEDDENLGMLLREYLQAKDYDADLFSDGEAGYKAFLKGNYDRTAKNDYAGSGDR